MLRFFKGLLSRKVKEPQVEVPYKVEAPEPAKCGCGRSQTGFCVGLHKLTPEEWAVHKDNPAKPKKAKAPAKPKAEKKPAEKKPRAKKAAK